MPEQTPALAPADAPADAYTDALADRGGGVPEPPADRVADTARRPEPGPAPGPDPDAGWPPPRSLDGRRPPGRACGPAHRTPPGPAGHQPAAAPPPEPASPEFARREPAPTQLASPDFTPSEFASPEPAPTQPAPSEFASPEFASPEFARPGPAMTEPAPPLPAPPAVDPGRSAAADRARQLLARHPVVDGHNNLPWALCGSGRRDLGRVDLAGGEPGLRTDLPRLRAGGVGAQFWTVRASSGPPGDHALSTVFDQIDVVHGLVRSHPEALRLVHTADEIPEARNYGRIAALLGVAGGHCIDNSLATLRALYALGVRCLALTHDRNTAWADAAADEPAVGGLSPFGEEVVCEMNRLGMLVDLSRSAPRTMRQALAVSKAPVVFSHSAARARCDHPANVPDDVLRLLPRNGGVCMVTFAPQYVSQAVADWLRGAQEAPGSRGGGPGGPAPVDRAPGDSGPVATVADVADHIEHVREVAGVDHVALGGDFDGSAPGYPAGLEDVSCYPALIAELLERGWSEADVAKLTWHNPIRALRGAEFTARSAQRRRPPSTATIERLDGPAAACGPPLR